MPLRTLDEVSLSMGEVEAIHLKDLEGLEQEQGLLWEGITTLSLLLAGANILVLRRPETLKLVKETIGG